MKIRRLSGRTNILVLNGGSSSIRFALFQAADPMIRQWQGKLERRAIGPAELSFHGSDSDRHQTLRFDAGDSRSLTEKFTGWLRSQDWYGSIDVVGHRLSHGMQYFEPQAITEKLLAELRRMMPFDPQHLPLELELINSLRGINAELPQIACFDTAFHQHMPRVAKLLPIPRRYYEKGVRRYGFHGLSFASISEDLRRQGEPALASGRIVYAHLGSAASVAAVLNGAGIDTSMAFTSSAGMVMGSRCGDLDPGIVSYLSRSEKMSIDLFERMVNLESGMLGISESSSDMRQLLELESRDERAAEAVEIFCSGARKWIAAMAAALGGLDVLVFTGGIGENSALIRERIGNGLAFLGVGIDRSRNFANEQVISPDESDVRVRIAHADEELILASEVARIIEGQTRVET
jgi:acetate kinase